MRMSCSSVLLIEDHADTRLILSSVLRHHGFLVAESNDGKEGLRAAQRLRPDALITDLHLPKVDGCAVIQTLKQEPGTAEIATLMLTIDGRDEAREQAQAAGCDEFILKPVTPDALVDTVRSVVRACALKAAATGAGWEQAEIEREMQRFAAEGQVRHRKDRPKQRADQKWMRGEVLKMLRSGWTWTELAEVGLTEAMLAQIGFDVEAPVAEWFKAEAAGRLR